MKPIIRNFISVIRRYKLALILNVLGLSVAFAAFMVIMIQLDYDYSFDKFHKDHDKIFRVDRADPTNSYTISARPFAELFFESSPNILAGTLTNPSAGDFVFHVETEGERNYYEEKVMMVSPSFTDVFTFDFVEGAEDVLKTPENVIIPLSLALKMFNNESAIGKQLFHQFVTVTVGAVYRDFPANSIFENFIFFPISESENKNNWGNQNYQMFIRVNDASNVPMLYENFKRNVVDSDVIPSGRWSEDNFLNFTALSDIRFLSGVQYDDTPKASKQALMILFSIAIVIIVIAGINFTNFSTALTPMRVKSLNTQLVLGARRRTLRSAIVSEAVIISFMSYLAALVLVDLFNKSPLAKLVDADLSFAGNLLIFGGTALVALLAGVFAGIYPSRYMTSFSPALVLKGNFGLSPKGKQLRNTLIGIQFVASITLIIGASFMYLQNWFMQNSDLGYEKDNLLTVNIGRIYENRDAFANQVKSYAGVENVTFGASLLASSDDYSAWGLPYNEEQVWVRAFPVHHTFLDVMGIEITEGRNFRQEDVNTEQGVWILNERTRNLYGVELNTTFDNQMGEIIGFMPDIKFASFRTVVRTMGFYVVPEGRAQMNIAYIKLNAGANLRNSMSHIHSTLTEFDSSYPFTIHFFDETLQRLYEKEISLSLLISLFSLLAIFISIVGVFGLVVFDSESRRKEIGIRKVFGASTLGIITMFNKGYFKILAVCFIIAAPLAWYAVTRWLENFAYKTPMYWWVYLLAFVAVAIITIATVTFQNWRVATANPVDAIKSE